MKRHCTADWDAEALKHLLTKKEKERFLEQLLEYNLIPPALASPLCYTALCDWVRNRLARRGYQARVVGFLWQTRLAIDGSRADQAGPVCCDCHCPLAPTDLVLVCMRCLGLVKMDCAFWTGDPHNEYLGCGKVLCTECIAPDEQSAPYGLHYGTILTPQPRPQRGH